MEPYLRTLFTGLHHRRSVIPPTGLFALRTQHLSLSERPRTTYIAKRTTTFTQDGYEQLIYSPYDTSPIYPLSRQNYTSNIDKQQQQQGLITMDKSCLSMLALASAGQLRSLSRIYQASQWSCLERGMGNLGWIGSHLFTALYSLLFICLFIHTGIIALFIGKETIWPGSGSQRS